MCTLCASGWQSLVGAGLADGFCAMQRLSVCESRVVVGSYMGSTEFSFSILPSHTSTNPLPNSLYLGCHPTQPWKPCRCAQAVMDCLRRHAVFRCAAHEQGMLVAVLCCEASSARGLRRCCLPASSCHCFRKPLHEAGVQRRLGVACRYAVLNFQCG